MSGRGPHPLSYGRPESTEVTWLELRLWMFAAALAAFLAFFGLVTLVFR
jgi:hypothetical protein